MAESIALFWILACVVYSIFILLLPIFVYLCYAMLKDCSRSLIKIHDAIIRQTNILEVETITKRELSKMSTT